MKREIKFRAFLNSKYYENPCMLSWEELLEQYDAIDMFQRDLMTLMQYTGLKDKNGREIYEGDIVDVGIEDQDGNPLFARVCYEKYAAGYVLDNGGNGIWQRLTEDCEVIGNIFENPELLEGKQ
ncbi:YopX family protein [Lacticaseibacillus paracasei]|uniref:YopX family protein n=1 Tax=Lacticaseibacillus paracasei TaxID=1597 RepID=UPI00209D2929|nr:YopX family protein [Lacticaseibacillus paracasei]UVH22827.1 YopX family protein [Lacticaseibacillus paracasei]